MTYLHGSILYILCTEKNIVVKTTILPDYACFLNFHEFSVKITTFVVQAVLQFQMNSNIHLHLTDGK